MSVPLVNKKRKSCDETLCLFCNSGALLVKQPKLESFTTIKRAAERRNDEIAGKFTTLYNPNSDVQSFSWHRGCMASYVSEEKIRRREVELLKDEEARLGSSAGPSNARDAKNESKGRSSERKPPEKVIKCLICNQKSKNRDYQLHLCSEEQAAQNIFNAANAKQDRVFTAISTCENPKDLFAIEVRYHKDCYRDYIRVPTKSEKQRGRPISKLSQQILEQAFDELISEIGNNLGSSSYELSYLAKRMAELTNINEAIIENRTIKTLLIEKYGEKIAFSYPSDRSKSSLVFLCDVPLGEVVDRVNRLDSEKFVLERSAKLLREEMLGNDLLPDAYLCDDVFLQNSLNRMILSPKWLIFMQLLISPNHKLGEKHSLRIKSIFSDIYYIITEKRTPKHVALAESIHHITRSKQIITMLNKLGHSISYKALKNIDTDVTISLLEEDNDRKVLIPKNIVQNPFLFLHGAIDNNDFNEETLSGKDTTHVTAMAIYQEKNASEVEIPHIKLRHTGEYRKPDLKSLNWQGIIHCSVPTVKPSVETYVNTKFLSNVSFPPVNSHLIWVLCRMKFDQSNSNFTRSATNAIPGWTSFHQLLSSETVPQSVVGYCPVIPHPPTSRDVVYTAMKNFHELCVSMKREISVLSCDMSIYLIAKNIQLSEARIPGLIIRVGSFHLQKNFLRCLGQFIEGSGLDQILIECEIYGENTLSSILKGLQYNRGIRAHKLLYEALRFLQLQEFIEQGGISSEECKRLEKIIQAFQEKIEDKDHVELVRKFNESKRITDDFLSKFSAFVTEMCCENQTFKFFNQYCEMVEILLDSIKADRESNYEIHIQSTRQMLPYFFSMNHTNYIRGVTLYLQDMLQLPKDVIDEFNKGMLSVKRSSGKFNSVGCDLALEQSQNRSSAVSGGLIGITRNEEAVQQWMLLYPFKNCIYSFFTSYLGMDIDTSCDINSTFHKEWSHSRISKDENDIKRLVSTLRDHNPFTVAEYSGLINIYNGTIPDDATTQCLLNIKQSGESLIEEFEKERFEVNQSSVFDSIKKHPFKNFLFGPNIKSKQKTSNKLQEANSLTLVQQSFMLATQRGFDLKILASHEILDCPSYLFDKDGLFRKSTKSVLASELERKCECGKSVKEVLSTETSKVYIVDGMAMVHQMTLKKFDTFGDFGEAFFSKIRALFSEACVKRVDVIFDRYDDISIKFMESKLRSKGISPKSVIITSPMTKIPVDHKHFFISSDNKLQLVKFLCENAQKFSGTVQGELYICGGFQDPENCYRISGTNVTEVIDLKSNHVEADSRMFCHIFHAMKCPSSEILILSPDTDVFVLGIYFWSSLSKMGCPGLWFQGCTKKNRFLGCHLAAEVLGPKISSILPALHALTGCDTTSRIGSKKQALSIASLDFVQKALSVLGSGILDLTQFQDLEEVCTYLVSNQRTTADNVRFKYFSQHMGFGINLQKVICTSDALYLHCQRATAQVFIWKNSWTPIIERIEMDNFGWELNNHHFYPKFISKPTVPLTMIEPCRCKSKCRTMSCNCKRNNVVCIALCKCEELACENVIL